MNTTPIDKSFDIDAIGYSLKNAYWLARAANIAYQEKSTIQPAVTSLGLREFEFLSKNDTEGFVAANDKIIVVAFRGTEPTHLQDLLADARIHKVSGPLGRIHRGFLGAFDLVKEDMFGAIQRMRNADNPQSLWFTGHSLGAALAAVAVAHLLARDESANGLYGFGQPRVGDDVYADEFNHRFAGRHIRFVNNNDSVTRVPPRTFGYSHTGELRYIDNTGTIQTDIGFWERFLDRVTGRMEDFLKPGTDGVKDHSMNRYVQQIENALKA